jgi:hypothetical protein
MFKVSWARNKSPDDVTEGGKEGTGRRERGKEKGGWNERAWAREGTRGERGEEGKGRKSDHYS